MAILADAHLTPPPRPFTASDSQPDHHQELRPNPQRTRSAWEAALVRGRRLAYGPVAERPPRTIFAQPTSWPRPGKTLAPDFPHRTTLAYLNAKPHPTLARPPEATARSNRP